MWIIGHRGASGTAPENTLAAFRRAVELGAQAIETDLQLSRDGRLVILHDDKLQRTTNGRGHVGSKTLDELLRLDAGCKFGKHRLRKRRGPASPFIGERIPTVEETLDFGREHNIGLYLEVKAHRGSGAEEAVVTAIRAANASSRVHVICFDLAVLRRVRELDPAIPLGYLFNRYHRDTAARAVDIGADTLLPGVSHVKSKLIEEAARRNLKVVTWTVNTPKRLKEMIALGVDGIMTNYPERLAALLRGT